MRRTASCISIGSGTTDVDNMDLLMLPLLGRLISGPLPPSLETNSENWDKIGECCLLSDFKGDLIGLGSLGSFFMRLSFFTRFIWDDTTKAVHPPQLK